MLWIILLVVVVYWLGYKSGKVSAYRKILKHIEDNRLNDKPFQE